MQILPAELAPRESPAPHGPQGSRGTADPSANATRGPAGGGFAAVLVESTERSTSTAGDGAAESEPPVQGEDGGRPPQPVGRGVEAGKSAAPGGAPLAEQSPATAGTVAAPAAAVQGDARTGAELPDAELQGGEEQPGGDQPSEGLLAVQDVVPAAASSPTGTVGTADAEAAASAAGIAGADAVHNVNVGEEQVADDATPADESPEPEDAGTVHDALAGPLPDIAAGGTPQPALEPGVPESAAEGADTGSSPGLEQAVSSAQPGTLQSTSATPNGLDAENAAGTKNGAPAAAKASTGALEPAPSDPRTGTPKPEVQGTDGRLVDARAKGAGSPTAPSTVVPVATARDGAGSAASGDGRHAEGRDAHTGRAVVDHATVTSDAEADGELSGGEEPAVSSLRPGAGAVTQGPTGRPAGRFGAASTTPGATASVAGASGANGNGAGADVPSRAFGEGALMGSGPQSAFPQGEVAASPAGTGSTSAADAARTVGTMARVEQAIEAGLDRDLVGRLRDDGQMRLAVRSEGLGELDVRVAVRESGVHATIGASHDEARQLLNSQRADLAAALERYNLRLDSFSVDVGSQEGRSGMRQEDAQGSFAHQAGLSSDDPQPVVARSVSPNPHRVGGLSVRA